ncbi:MAG: pitrilysin family protein [Bauldia sp.]
MSVRTTRLPSGLTVVSHDMADLESAALGVWIKAGSRSEEEHEHGIAHLLEHMAFKGTRNRTAIDIAEEIEAVGGELNAATSVETTSYYARVLKADVPLAVDILSDILRNSLFDRQELAKEKEVIVQEIGAAEDTPDDKVYDLFNEAAFPGQPIGRPILGTEHTVRAFRPEGIMAYLERHYTGPEMVVSAAGAVDHDALVALVEKGFSGIATQRAPRVVPAAYRGGEVRETRDLQEAQIVLGFEGRPYHADDFYATQMLAAVLGGGMSSRLFQEVREKRGLCYSIYAFHWSFADSGLMAISAATGEGKVADLMPVILGELERAAGDISEKELARARAQMRAGLLMALESPSARAGQLARQLQLYGRPLELHEIVERIDSVDVAAVRRVAQEILTQASPTIAAIGPVDKLLTRDRIAKRLGAPH